MTSLTNWDKNKVLKFSIDNTYISEDLTDFPVLLNLSAIFMAIRNSAPMQFSGGTVQDIRISNIARSGAWIKAVYNSNIDELVIYNDPETYTAPPAYTYTYQGTIKEKSQPIIRNVLLYERTTGLLIDSTTSNAGGEYLLETHNDVEHFIVVLDDLSNYKYAPIIQDRLLPNGD